MSDTQIQPGPCVVCGLRNYGLSYGGPTICPACDCGDSGPSRMNAQRERIAELEFQLSAERGTLEQIGLQIAERERLRAALCDLVCLDDVMAEHGSGSDYYKRRERAAWEGARRALNAPEGEGRVEP